MPALIGGAVKVVNMGAGATLQFGDTAAIVPKHATKSQFGGGSFLTGDFGSSQNALSNTTTIDTDVIDNNNLIRPVIFKR